jgi:RNA ligase (TIGR02306 family)
MERKLVSIQSIRKLIPIKGADFIELAMVNDWTCIVKKGEFVEGSKCVYFEIDSLLPEEPRYEFLASSKRDYFGIPKYRIKTMKMRGVISQGLALPLSTFPELTGFEEGDISEKINVIKYDPDFYTDNGRPQPKAGNSEGRFPSFIPKTDQERIQNLPHYYEMYKDHEWEETLKLDGSSLTCYKIETPLSRLQRFKQWFGFKQSSTHFGVCSRNLELKPSDTFSKTFDNGNSISEYNQSDFWKIMIQLEVEKYLPAGFALQGELIGPKIQSNHEKVDTNQFWIFDIYNIKEVRYLTPTERLDFVFYNIPSKLIHHVPIIEHAVKIFDICPDLTALQKRVTGESINPGTVSEGRVYKSRTVPGLSFKCISNEYLLKNND